MLLMSWGLTGLYRSFIDPPSPQTIHSCILDSLRINGAFAAMVLSSNIKNPIILHSQFELPQPDYCNQKILIWSNICPTAQFTLMRVKVLPRLYGVSHSLHWKTCCIRLYLFVFISLGPHLRWCYHNTTIPTCFDHSKAQETHIIHGYDANLESNTTFACRVHQCYKMYLRFIPQVLRFCPNLLNTMSSSLFTLVLLKS